MAHNRQSAVILLAEDDEDNYLLTLDAMRKAALRNALKWVRDGEEVMAYLLRRGPYQDPLNSPRPDLILLDLNMPKKDGREVLQELRAHPDLKKIPVVVLTTTKAEEDILRSYELGGNSFIQKPVDFDQYVQVMRVLGQYWFGIVELPK